MPRPEKIELMGFYHCLSGKFCRMTPESNLKALKEAKNAASHEPDPSIILRFRFFALDDGLPTSASSTTTSTTASTTSSSSVAASVKTPPHPESGRIEPPCRRNPFDHQRPGPPFRPSPADDRTDSYEKQRCFFEMVRRF